MKQNELKNIDYIIKNIYDFGCYFMDLLYVGLNREPSLSELVAYYNRYNELKYIDYECTVLNPVMILEDLTGEAYKVRKDSVLDKSADIIIGLYYNPRTNLHHFVLLNKNGNVKWDSLGESVTVKEGFIESHRLFYREVK